jgi:hypothetical protein
MINAESLSTTVRFHCPDDLSAAALTYVGAEPGFARAEVHLTDYRIEAVGGSFYDFAPPHAGRPGSVENLVERANLLLRRLAVKESADTPLLHAGSVVVGGRRFLMVAPKGVGKTTLLLKCLHEGIGVEGDENVALLSNGEVVSRPRRMRIRAHSLELVPELGEAVRAAPSMTDWNGLRVFSFPPEMPGQPWHITQGPADFLMFLEPNHGGRTTPQRIGHEEGFQRTLNNAYLLGSRRAEAVALLHVLVKRSQLWKMHLGDLDGALWHLRQISRL